jgi:uncharacterized protein YbjT (DUF2867 family)
VTDERVPVTALVVGATGLVGGHLVRLLAGDPAYAAVRVVTRRPLTDPPPGIDQCIIDFDRLDEQASTLVGDHVFCALGTTRKAAGSAARFREVDLDYPRRIAAHARRNGARHFSLVSAIGANPRSPFLYNRVKGEVEAAVRRAGYPSGAILRPSVLGGQRAGRPLERVAQALMRGIPGRWRTVDAADVARAAILVARAEEQGWRVIESDQIRRIATRPPLSRTTATPPD